MLSLRQKAEWLAFLVVAVALLAGVPRLLGADPAPFGADAPAPSYEVPQDADSQALMDFISKILSFRPTTLDQYQTHKVKAPEAVKQAAERIFALEKDPQSKLRRQASTILLLLRAQAVGEASPEERQQLLADVKAHLAGQKPTDEDVRIATTLARELEYGGAPEVAAQAYGDFAELFAQSKDERLNHLAELFRGCERRLSLRGKKLETLTGTKFDGTPFDWNAYRGKVVLVDFWATWCGPCIAELPNVRRLYAAYHDRGFDVVGISLDRDRDSLESFLKREQLPWTTLHEAEGRNPMAEHYGVMAIPTALLVDKDGTVVSLRATGRELEAQLEKLLGPVEK